MVRQKKIKVEEDQSWGLDGRLRMRLKDGEVLNEIKEWLDENKIKGLEIDDKIKGERD